ncbi:DNA-3-methyladenine glycosylase [Nocardiopsis terrae]|uniref:DNA-3-methyladenine glycosylase I n=1 Tax=Nocardiopsis terrae TaxID=372655 RepID=A0ABR9HNV1_9ACTN|nr:DNA-3-methyladenine glycosylase I [Nocardiopsis terrae]MBE1460699.1 DNA-3-methyladenine glycosylase I [Nocardiopsis terrae]GHC72971.1 DNA-3-methyladenine glycosylase [Nocardiopsis terrae]
MTDTDDRRCAWARNASELMTAYHDTEWGRVSHEDGYLFEMLVLEGAQAGLSWSTVLNKRENYRRAMDGFDYGRIAAYGQAETDRLLADPGIVRNRLKVASAVRNARAFLAVREEFGSFDAYLWGWVPGPVVGHWTSAGQVPVTTDLSDRLSKDLRKRGFNFVGSTIVYSYLQATGLVEDHLEDCPAKPG